MKTILMIIVLGTQGGFGNPVEPPRITMQEFGTENQCQIALEFLEQQEFSAWESKVIGTCIAG